MIYSLISIVLLVGLDRFSKILAVKYLSGGTPVTVIPHILGLRYTENTGAAFSKHGFFDNHYDCQHGIFGLSYFYKKIRHCN